MSCSIITSSCTFSVGVLMWMKINKTIGKWQSIMKADDVYTTSIIQVGFWCIVVDCWGYKVFSSRHENINSDNDSPIVVLAVMLSFCPLTGGLGVIVIELIFPWSDDFAANTDQDQITENMHHIKLAKSNAVITSLWLCVKQDNKAQQARDSRPLK